MKTAVATLVACAVMALAPQVFAQQEPQVEWEPVVQANAAPEVPAAAGSQAAEASQRPQDEPSAQLNEANEANESQPHQQVTSSTSETTDSAGEVAAPADVAAEQTDLQDEVYETPLSEPAPPPTAAAGPNIGIDKLELKLRDVDTRKSSYSQFLPWATVVFGAAATVGGTVAGSAYAFGCEPGECNTPSWVGIIVATGTLVASLGVIWVVRTDADRRELDSERYHLQQEIDRLRLSARQRNGVLAGSSLLSMRLAL